jgi:hypothetical protein
MGLKIFVKKLLTDGIMVQMLSNGILKWTICCLMSFHIPLKNIQMDVLCLRGNHFFGGEINQKLTSLMAIWHVHLEINALKMMSLFTFPCSPWHHYHTLHQYASKFILFFLKFWVKLNKSKMLKVGNPLMNRDKLLWTSEFKNS